MFPRLFLSARLKKKNGREHVFVQGAESSKRAPKFHIAKKKPEEGRRGSESSVLLCSFYPCRPSSSLVQESPQQNV